jgi:hypothetical protein
MSIFDTIIYHSKNLEVKFFLFSLAISLMQDNELCYNVYGFLF